MSSLDVDLPEGLPQYLSVPEAAKMLGCRERHVWSMVHTGALPSTIVGKRTRRIPLAQLLKQLDDATTTAAPGSG